MNFIGFVIKHIYLFGFLIFSNMFVMIYGNKALESKVFDGFKSVLFSILFFIFCFLIFFLAYKIIDKFKNYTTVNKILLGGGKYHFRYFTSSL